MKTQNQSGPQLPGRLQRAGCLSVGDLGLAGGPAAPLFAKGERETGELPELQGRARPELESAEFRGLAENERGGLPLVGVDLSKMELGPQLSDLLGREIPEPSKGELVCGLWVCVQPCLVYAYDTEVTFSAVWKFRPHPGPVACGRSVSRLVAEGTSRPCTHWAASQQLQSL